MSLQEKYKFLEEKTIGNQKIRQYKNRISIKEIFLICCGIGKVNSAIGSTLALNRLSSDCIINIGSAGGFPPCKIGDIIIAKNTAYYDVDLTMLGYQFGQGSMLPLYFEADLQLLKTASACVSRLNVPFRQGLIVSGDSFMSPDRALTIQKIFPKVYAAEMEGCSIAHVCHVFKKPFLVIRSISDYALQENSKIDFEANLPLASKNACSLIKEIIEVL